MIDDILGGADRRQTLKCMLWAGTGVLWTVAGGVPASCLIGSARAAESGFSFVQISDSHIGFSKPANPDARVTLDAAIDKIVAMPGKPAFMIHTGDITHTAQPAAVRRRAADDRPREARRPLRPGRARHPRSRDPDRLSRPLRQGRDRRRLVFVRPGRRPFRLAGQCRRPQEERPRLAGGGADSPGSTTICTASPPRRRSSSSPTFRSG